MAESFDQAPAFDLNIPPVGHCIYCGATRYSDQRDKLGDEHVIPEAMDGEILLPLASCAECERQISKYEQYCLKAMFGPIRYVARTRSKRPKDRPTTLPQEILLNGEWHKHDAPLDQSVAPLLMPLFDLPDIVRGLPPRDRNLATRNFWFAGVRVGEADAEVGAKPDGRYIKTRGRSAPVAMIPMRFARFLAKMAHGFAYAEFGGKPGFNPVLLDLILNRPSPWPVAYLVGGLPDLEPASGDFVDMGLMVGDGPMGRIIMVHIRLFGRLGAPTYRVVASVDPLPPPMTA